MRNKPERTPDTRSSRGGTLARQFNLLLPAVGLLIAALTVIPMLFEFQRVTNQVARDMAQLHATELVGDLEARIGREIALVEKMGSDMAILDWMASPGDPEKKRAALRAFQDFNRLLADHNSFAAVASTLDMYFPGSVDATSELVPAGHLEESVEGDAWYFETIQANQTLQLNIDVDRFLGSMRIWLNLTVRRDGHVLGILGTGLDLTPFLQSFFAQHEALGAESVIFNRFGDIQLAASLEQIRQNSFDAAGDTTQSVYRYGAGADFSTLVRDYLDAPRTVVAPIRSDRFDYVALAPIANTDWSVATFFSTRALFDSRRLLPLLGLLLAGLAAVTILVGIFMRRLFVTPFSRLVESIRNQDALRGIITIEGENRIDEFGVLARAIRQMSERWVHAIPVGIFLIDTAGVFLYANPSMCAKFSADSPEALNRLQADRPSGIFIHDADHTRFLDMLAQDGDLMVLEAELQGRDGPFWADLRLQRISTSGEPPKWECVLLDIQEKKAREKALEDEVLTDPLTGLLNRKWFQERMEEEIARADRYGGHPALVLFDLDHFKEVNDRHGHDVGDRVLKAVAGITRTCVRASDHVVRWGGEEFAVLMPEGNESSAWIVAEKIRQRLEQSEHPESGIVTASFGAAARHGGESAAEWFRRADQALYRAKREGRNRVVRADGSETPASGHSTVLRMVWQPNLACGHPVIDHQHQTLFHLANTLADAVSTDAGTEVLAKCYEELLTHFRQHARDEEAILSSSSWDAAKCTRHKALHQHLLETMEEWRGQMVDPASDHAALLLELVRVVVFQHLMQEDMPFFPYVR